MRFDDHALSAGFVHAEPPRRGSPNRAFVGLSQTEGQFSGSKKAIV